MTVRIELTAPIQAHGDEVRAIDLRAPNGGDMRACGHAYRVSVNGDVIYDAPVLSALMARLAGIPLSSVDQMVAADWRAAADTIVGFTLGTSPKPS